MNWSNLLFWGCIVIVYSWIFADLETALTIVAFTALIIAVMKFDYWVMNKYEQWGKQ